MHSGAKQSFLEALGTAFRVSAPTPGRGRSALPGQPEVRLGAAGSAAQSCRKRSEGRPEVRRVRPEVRRVRPEVRRVRPQRAELGSSAVWGGVGGVPHFSPLTAAPGAVVAPAPPCSSRAAPTRPWWCRVSGETPPLPPPTAPGGGRGLRASPRGAVFPPTPPAGFCRSPPVMVAGGRVLVVPCLQQIQR